MEKCFFFCWYFVRDLSPFKKLPLEITMLILGLLNAKELCLCSQVHSHFLNFDLLLFQLIQKRFAFVGTNSLQILYCGKSFVLKRIIIISQRISQKIRGKSFINGLMNVERLFQFFIILIFFEERFCTKSKFEKEGNEDCLCSGGGKSGE